MILCVLLLAAGARAQDEVSWPSDRNIFGVVEAFWLPDAACEMGAGWERIIFDWAQHQPNGPDDWNTLNVDDRWLEAARACDREVIAVIKHTPAWATDGIPGPGVPRGLYLPVEDPNNLWATFVRRAAAYYRERGVRRFIVWNEPDITPDTYGFEFEGSLEDYARLVEVAYFAAREGSPDARIHLAGTTYWHDVNARRRLYVDRLLEALVSHPDAAQHGAFFDALTLHIYFRSETVYDITREMRALLERYGLGDKEIWIGEMNASPNLDPLWAVTRPNWQIDLDQQAAYLVQAAALGLAAGADYIGVYKFFDWSLPPGAESFGLIRADESRRPAFDTWRMVIDQMNGVEAVHLARTDRMRVVRLRRADGIDLYIAWAHTAEAAQVRIHATSDLAEVFDQYGNMMQVRPHQGTYTLALPGAVCNPRDGCPVGGRVTLLAQPAGDAAVMEIQASGDVPLRFEG